MERMLRYSLEHQRAIRMMLIAGDGRLRQVKAVVERMEGRELTLYILRPPERLQLRVDDVLSADYAGGDDGM